MTNKKGRLARAMTACLLVVAASTQAAEPVDVIMKDKLEDILAAVNQPGADAQQKLHGAIDFPSITRGVLGKHRKAVSDTQRQRFQVEFEASMVALLKAATQSAGDYSIIVTGSKLSEKNSERGQAYATVQLEDGQIIEIVSSIALLEGEWKVRNLIFGGVNLGKTYRSQFDQLVQQYGGDFDQAIAAWAARTEENGVAAAN